MSKDSIVILDYGSGNLRSAAKAFEKIIADRGLDFDVVVSNQAKDIDAAGHIVLPGQGAFADCITGLEESGLIDALEKNVLQQGKPFLGICVGMQLLADRGLEGGAHAGLGWISGEVVPMKPANPDLKIPHMGWNELLTPAPSEQDNAHELLRHVQKDTHYYFVHSYVFQVRSEHHVLGYVDYGGLFPAVIGRDNIVGIQFHPEKSHDAGLEILSAFVDCQP